jgi:hypothetical protein
MRGAGQESAQRDERAGPEKVEGRVCQALMWTIPFDVKIIGDRFRAAARISGRQSLQPNHR